MMKKTVAFLLVLLLLSLTYTTTFAYSLDGGSYPSGSIGYYVKSSVPSTYVSSVKSAASMWSNNTDANLWYANDFIGPLQYRCDVTAGSYGDIGWDGGSTMSPGWGQTYSVGTIMLNTTYTANYSSNRLKLVTCHEFGHILGLDHVSSYVMMYGSDVWVAYQNNSSLLTKPAQDDINGVNAIY